MKHLLGNWWLTWLWSTVSKQKTIYEYHRVDVKNKADFDITNGSAIIFVPQPTCQNLTSCEECTDPTKTDFEVRDNKSSWGGWWMEIECFDSSPSAVGVPSLIDVLVGWTGSVRSGHKITAKSTVWRRLLNAPRQRTIMFLQILPPRTRNILATMTRRVPLKIQVTITHTTFGRSRLKSLKLKPSLVWMD